MTNKELIDSVKLKEKVFIKWFRIIFFLFIALYILYKITPQVSDLIVLLIASVLLAYVLDPPVSYFERIGVPRIIGILIMYVGITIIIIIGLTYLFPKITTEINSLTAKLENQQLSTVMGNIQDFIKTKLPFVDVESLDIFDKMQVFMGNALKEIFNFLIGFVSLFTTIVILPVTTFLFLKDSHKIFHGFISIIPNRYFEFTLDLIHKINLQIGAYIRGVLTDAFAIGLLSTIGLAIVGTQYFYVFGAIAGICNIIPYFGPVAGAIPAIVVTILDTGSFTRVPLIILVFVIVQLIDNVVIQPYVYGKKVNIHPIVVIFAILAGGRIWGIFGMLISIPFFSTLKVTFQQIIWGLKNYRL